MKKRALKKKRKANGRVHGLLAALLLSGLIALGAGCEGSPDEPDVPVNLAREHARSEGEYLGERVVVYANEAILLNPMSSRQRLSRETLLRIDELVKPADQYPAQPSVQPSAQPSERESTP